MHATLLSLSLLLFYRPTLQAEEFVITLPAKEAHLIEENKEGTLKSYLALVQKMDEYFEIKAVLNNEKQWLVLLEAKKLKHVKAKYFTVQIGLHKPEQRGRSPLILQKKGLQDMNLSYYVTAKTKDNSKVLRNIGEVYVCWNDRLELKMDGVYYTLDLK
ncbi:hypothetical protein Rhal01_01319 [Rubritalea halochordaticola]|uniref:Uncharacterized protein n=1 Tax=Rubritalea halochordaticola TaxID=714537 RepID=A0ABP9UXQ0_9BACT